MKKSILAIMALFTALVAGATVTVSNITGPTAVTNGIPELVTAQVTSSGDETPSILLVYRNILTNANDSTWKTNIVQMSMSDDDGIYQAYIPSVGAGFIGYCVKVAGEEILPTDWSNEIAVYEWPEDPVRHMDFSTVWQRADTNWVDTTEKAFTNYYLNVMNGSGEQDKWRASGVYFSDEFLIPGGSGRAMSLYNNESMNVGVNPYIVTPFITGGVGTIYFSATMGELFASGAIEIQITRSTKTDSLDILDDEWSTVETIEFENRVSEPFEVHAKPVTVNDSAATRVRIVRTVGNKTKTGKADGQIIIDNFVISAPPTDIELVEHLRNPGYPATDQEIKMRVSYLDVIPAAPARNVKMTLFYQHLTFATDKPKSSSWISVPMLSKANGIYEGIIPPQEAGYIAYYYRADFDGYNYGRDPDGDHEVNYGPEGFVVMGGVEDFYYESLSPKYFTRGVTLPKLNHDQQTYSVVEIRPFHSNYSRVAIESEDTPGIVVSNLTLVADNEWQYAVKIDNTMTNFTWNFVGYDEYVDDAEKFDSEPVIWGDSEQSFTAPPLAGKLVDDPARQSKIQAEFEYDGFVLFRANVNNPENMDYIVKRAVYQNFDEWDAAEDWYEQSWGLYATQRFENDFDDWTESVYPRDENRAEHFDNKKDLEDNITIYPNMTDQDWERSYSRYVSDGRGLTNNALLIANGGYIQNTIASVGRGTKELTFMARVAIDADHPALYKDGTEWKVDSSNGAEYHFKLAGECDIESTNSYVSAIFLYEDALGGDGASYYEARFRKTYGSNSKEKVMCELLRYNGNAAPGTKPTKLKSKELDATLGSFNEYVIGVTNSSGTAVDIYVQKAGDGKNGLTYQDKSGITGGTIGFNAFECLPKVCGVSTKEMNNKGKYVLNALSFDAASWYLGGKRRDDVTEDRWTFDAWSTEPNVLTRRIPTEKFEIWELPRSNDINSTNGSTTAFSKYLQYKTEVKVNSCKYQKITIPFDVWNETYIQIRHCDGDAAVVIDELHVEPWRAQTRTAKETEVYDTETSLPYYYWTSIDQQNRWLATQKKNWVVLDGWMEREDAVLVDSGFRASFDVTRANPNLVQGVVSPYLENGIGSISFQYDVAAGGTGDVIYAVEYSKKGVDNDWYTAAEYTNSVGESGNRYCKIAAPYGGRIRIRMLSDVSSRAVLRIDHLLAKDYPLKEGDVTSWEVFNCKVTGTDTDENRLYNNIGRTCYLNNSPTADTHDGDYSDDNPYIQTPIVGTGIGEISFYYRLYTNANPTATLRIMSAPSLDAEQWNLVTNLIITASEDAQFVKFYNPSIYNLKDKFVRFYSSNGNDDRICIDEILVTEPVRAGYEIYKVELDPVQPLSYSNVNLRVEIGRFIMDPQDIEIYCSYHVGSDDWGYTNWWDSGDTTGSKRIKLEREPDSNVFTTTVNSNIPKQDVDKVVQFVVWGTHDNLPLTFDNVVFQGTNTFVNPEWYAPVDLNAQNEESGWSPYYFSYSCPPRSVRFNEINYWRNGNDDDWCDFAEIIGPAGADIGNWRFEIVDDNENPRMGTVTYDTIPSGTKFQNEYRGYGFYAWGDYTVDDAAKKTSNLKVDLVPLNDLPNDPNDIGEYGAKNGVGMRIYRSNGAIEDKICFSTKTLYLEAAGYTFCGAKSSGGTGSLGLTLPPRSEESVVTLDTLEWSQVADYTPHYQNFNEDLTPIDPIPGGDEPAKKFKLTSVIKGVGGTQDGGTQTISTELEAGSSTSIVYRANDWSRIKTLKSNGGSVSVPADAKTYTFTVQAISSDISNEVEFGEAKSPVEGVPVEWLATKGTEADIDNAIENGDGDDLAVYEEYLLNTDPTVKTNVKFGIASIAVDDENVALEVELERTEDDGQGMKTITAPINGRLTIYSSEDLTMFDDTTVEPVVVPASDGNFFKAKIEGKAE